MKPWSVPCYSSSGPYGEDTPDPWGSVAAIREKYRKVLRLRVKRFRP